VPHYFPGLLPSSHRKLPPVTRSPAGVYSDQPIGPEHMDLSKSDVLTKVWVGTAGRR
jgi:hypothetical protein